MRTAEEDCVCGGGGGRSAGIGALPRNASEKLGAGKLPPTNEERGCDEKHQYVPKERKTPH